MKKITFLIALCIASLSFAQQGINYKAIVKDASGNVLNEFMNVEFTIHEASETGTIVYQEDENYTLVDGLLIHTIGTVASPTVGVFANIDWAANTHYLNTTISYSGGSDLDMGTTQFMAVPYDKHATTAANVSGLEKITENGISGWRFIERNPDNHGDIGLFGVDLTFNDGISNIFGAIGTISFAFGSRTSASGDYSIAMGRGLQTDAINSSSFGRYNIGGGNPTVWENIDPLFEIGNGTDDSNRSNVLTILKNGTITAPSFELAEITDDKALITKEYLEANSSIGLEKTTENGQTGWRLKGRDPNNYGNIGLNAIDLSISNSTSTTYGATGNNSVAIGGRTQASGFGSTATGDRTIALGQTSTAMGNQTKADAMFSTAIGSFNIGGGDENDWIGTDPIFEIGNSFLGSPRSNALTVLKNGTITAPSLTNGLINTAGNKALITKEYADNEYLSESSSSLLPIAYGSFDGNTTSSGILSGTGNFTITRDGANTYTISVTGESLSTSNCSASAVVNTSNFRSVNITYLGGNMLVHVFGSAFTKVASPFQFIIYKN